jgi:hypothetical protein
MIRNKTALGSGWEGFFKQMHPNRNAKVSLRAKMVSHETK